MKYESHLDRLLMNKADFSAIISGKFTYKFPPNTDKVYNIASNWITLWANI